MAFRQKQAAEVTDPGQETRAREKAERADVARRRFHETCQQAADHLRVQRIGPDLDELELHEAATALVKQHAK